VNLSDKPCSVCKKTLPAEAFYVNQHKLRSSCKACDLEKKRQKYPGERPRQSAYKKARYQEKRELILAQVREYRIANAEAVKARKADYYARNRLQHNLKTRAWHAANIERVRANRRRYRRENPDVILAAQQRRRGRMVAVESSLSTAEWLEILEYHDHRCAYCLEKCDKLELEHIVAVSRGGGTTKENVVPACRSCNARKCGRPVFMMAAFI
jgi:5-methylcytosine-specific restriction endonuclease McrA